MSAQYITLFSVTHVSARHITLFSVTCLRDISHCFTLRVLLHLSRWKEVWLERLHKSTEPWIHKWLSHQTRDHYWEHGSVCEDYGAIKCPVLLIGGFSDLYTDSVFRMMEHLTCPLKALIGPWSHDWPANSTPGPQIDHLKECLRWWDCHLKGLCIGIMEEPTLRLFQRESKSIVGLIGMEGLKQFHPCVFQVFEMLLAFVVFAVCHESRVSLCQ